MEFCAYLFVAKFTATMPTMASLLLYRRACKHCSASTCSVKSTYVSMLSCFLLSNVAYLCGSFFNFVKSTFWYHFNRFSIVISQWLWRFAQQLCLHSMNCLSAIYVFSEETACYNTLYCVLVAFVSLLLLLVARSLCSVFFACNLFKGLLSLLLKFFHSMTVRKTYNKNWPKLIIVLQ